MCDRNTWNTSVALPYVPNVHAAASCVCSVSAAVFKFKLATILSILLRSNQEQSVTLCGWYIAVMIEEVDPYRDQKEYAMWYAEQEEDEGTLNVPHLSYTVNFL